MQLDFSEHAHAPPKEDEFSHDSHNDCNGNGNGVEKAYGNGNCNGNGNVGLVYANGNCNGNANGYSHGNGNGNGYLHHNRAQIFKAEFETVGCAAVDSFGNCAAATSTGGLVNKMSGRIGKKPNQKTPRNLTYFSHLRC